MCLDSLFLFAVLTLLSMSGQANAGGYFWRFKIWETYTVSETSLTGLVGTGDCSPKGCQSPSNPGVIATLDAIALSSPRLRTTARRGHHIPRNMGDVPIGRVTSTRY
jgi:hypothetical protein